VLAGKIGTIGFTTPSITPIPWALKLPLQHFIE
jgi:hypothetical protein